MSNLLKYSKGWGDQVFSLSYPTNTHIIKVKPCFSDGGYKLASITNWDKFIAEQEDIMPIEDQIDPEDRGVVKRFKIEVDGQQINLVSKLIRAHRVPSNIHEIYICHLLKSRGINVPDTIALFEPKSQVEQAPGYIIMREIENAYSLHQLYRNPARIIELFGLSPHSRPPKSHIKDLRRRTAKEFGRAIHKYLLTGIIHEELDLKNICVTRNSNLEFYFLDFERTRIFLDLPNPKTLFSAYKESIPRRLGRYRLSKDEYQEFANGYVSLNPMYDILDLINCIKDLQTKSHKRNFIIGIDGYAGAGKSTIAELLAKSLPNTTILDTDMFMAYSRDERQFRPELFENHPAWYDIESLSRFLVRILRADSSYSETLHNLYDHATGTKCLKRNFEIPKGEIIIVEGMYALSPLVFANYDLSMFLTAQRRVLFERVYRRDSQQRGVARELISKRFEIINGSYYRRFAEENKHKANLIIDSSKGVDSSSLVRLDYRLLGYFLNIDSQHR